MTTITIIVCGGDSLTATAIDYPYQAYGFTSVGDGGLPDVQAACVYRNGNILMKNMGITGTRLNTNGYPDLVPLAPVYIDPIVANKTTISTSGTTVAPLRKYIFSCFIGSNDGALGNFATADLYAAAVASACVARKTAGYDFAIVGTLLPRSDGIMTEPNRLLYNSTIKGVGWAAGHGIDGIFDMASDAIMGDPANLPLNNGGVTTWYSADNVHPTQAGQARLAPIWLATVNAIIATF